MYKDREENKYAQKIIKNYVYQFRYKGNVLAEPQGSVEHSLNTVGP